jgi:hypothetical protein
MKKLMLCLGLLAAIAAPSSNAHACAATTYQSGASTTLDQTLFSDCAVYGWDGGLTTKNFTANCCVTSVWIRVNYNDFSALLAAGKLEGLRYERVYKDANGNTVTSFRKITGSGFTVISSEDFSR